MERRTLFDWRILPLHPWGIVIASAAILSFLFKIYIALTTYGTNDVLYWERFLATANHEGGIGLYHRIEYFNHPPFMIHLLHLLDFLARSTGVAFAFWMRIPAILADLASIFVVWKILAQDKEKKVTPMALLLMAMAPTSIMVSGFHGNTDPLMIFFVLLSTYLIESRQPTWLAGLVMGMALNIKMVPVIFIPAVLLYLRTARSRIEYVSGIGTMVLVCSIPYVFQEPVFIIRRVLGYGSIYGQWGLSRFLNDSLPERYAWINAAYADFGKFVVVTVIIGASVWMNTLIKRPSLFTQLSLVVFIFMSLTPGFGIQYLAWLVPWVVGLGAEAAAIYYLASGLFQFAVYTFWSQGFPWFLADSDRVGPWRDYVVHYEVLCWAVVVGITLTYFSPGRLWRIEEPRSATGR